MKMRDKGHSAELEICSVLYKVQTLKLGCNGYKFTTPQIIKIDPRDPNTKYFAAAETPPKVWLAKANK
jgi:hypothetical protein